MGSEILPDRVEAASTLEKPTVEQPEKKEAHRPTDLLATAPESQGKNQDAKAESQERHKAEETDRKIEEILGAENSDENIASKDLADLLELEDRNSKNYERNKGVLKSLFLKARDNPHKIMAPNEDLQKGKKYVVDFRGNNDSEMEIGAGDLLNSSVRKVIITTSEGVSEIGFRKVGKRVGYYTADGKYLAIFSGYTIEIPQEQDAVIARNSKEYIDFDREEGTAQQKRLERERGAKIAKAELKKNPKFTSFEKLNENEFVERAKEVARQIQTLYGIPWQVTVLQTCIETGYGKHMAPGSNNYFGIKAMGRYAGRKASAGTTEYYDGKKVSENADFRVYSGFIDSAFDYARLITKVYWHKVEPYAVTPEQSGNADLFLKAMFTPPPPQYGTDPAYLGKCTQVAARLKLPFQGSIEKDTAIA